MRIVFMRTPDFAVPALEKLLYSKHEIAAVVTTPDKERGRGQKVTFTAVKQFALDNNLPLFQPVKLKDELFISNLKKINADIFIIVAFRILPKEIFTIPGKGSFNLHASLLPKFRGAAPIQWALIKGEKITGVTTFKLEEKVDTGNTLFQVKIPVEDSDDFGTLHDKLSVLGADVVLKTADLIESGDYKLSEQDNSLATPAPKITKEIAQIDWNKNAEDIHNLIRGLSPYPGAFFIYKNKILKIYKTKIIDSKEIAQGQFVQTKRNLTVGCGSKALEILELQLEGKKRLKIDEFLRGFDFS